MDNQDKERMYTLMGVIRWRRSGGAADDDVPEAVRRVAHDERTDGVCRVSVL